eukprot:CAMPEP_0201876370 /NCGR_PEP_ID=MMETSP0902-20130614/8079_1 /ASSEMBLY_ACC=CAM_ASM_000551 /TAXON_ID=420261 /ORGANISM="Thalassiosira antarctica, Strain CCMP982" /LENGTH=139 /DNA_ID=CAMNT_0048403597 /DNA_START=447 /DNA_END=863 /DNA_ORIENTATION=+
MKISIPTCFFASLMTALTAGTVKAKCPFEDIEIEGDYDIVAAGIKNFQAEGIIFPGKTWEIKDQGTYTFQVQGPGGIHACAQSGGGDVYVWRATCAGYQSSKDMKNFMEMEFVMSADDDECEPTNVFFTNKRFNDSELW